MTATKHYDAIVIGAGQAGGPLSTALAQAGWRTAYWTCNSGYDGSTQAQTRHS